MEIGDELKGNFIATNGLKGQFEDYRGKWLILYFYPKDSTPGCTLEGQDFRDHFAELQAKQVVLFGVSRDSLPSHEKFKTKYHFPFELISDPEETLCNDFEVIKMKSLYGKTVRGIERSTFLINPQGKLCKVWRKVTVKGHVEEVLATLTHLQN